MGFGVWGLGFWFRVWGGFREWGLRLRSQGFEFGVGLGCIGFLGLGKVSGFVCLGSQAFRVFKGLGRRVFRGFPNPY